MEKQIDMHIHSTCSDGTCTPGELVRLAVNASLSAIALTDHDTVSGIQQMGDLCKINGIHFIPGIELSTEFSLPDHSITKEIHLLGFFIDQNSPDLLSYLEEYSASRTKRNREMVEKLKEHGFYISMEHLNKQFPDCIMTRAHIARYLSDSGQVKNLNEAFSKYIGDHACCYVSRPKISTKEAVGIIHRAGGIAVLAHPPLYRLSAKDLDAMVHTLVQDGLDGLEAVYSTYRNSEESDMKALAAKYNLLISGGSDFHGSNKPYIHLGTGRGNLHVPYSIYENMLHYYEKLHATDL
ncbi:MAG: PHP domain-containing protein [Lachnospiraceae bacterium]